MSEIKMTEYKTRLQKTIFDTLNFENKKFFNTMRFHIKSKGLLNVKDFPMKSKKVLLKNTFCHNTVYEVDDPAITKLKGIVLKTINKYFMEYNIRIKTCAEYFGEKGDKFFFNHVAFFCVKDEDSKDIWVTMKLYQQTPVPLYHKIEDSDESEIEDEDEDDDEDEKDVLESESDVYECECVGECEELFYPDQLTRVFRG